MEKKVYKVVYRVNGRNVSRKFDCMMDAEDFYVAKCRDFRCDSVDIQCFRNGVRIGIPSYMYSF